MSIVTDAASSTNSLAEFLNESGSRPQQSVQTDSEGFTAALQESLAGLGYSADEISISVGPAKDGSADSKHFTVTLKTETASEAAAENAQAGADKSASLDKKAASATLPVSPFHAAAPALRGLSAEPAPPASVEQQRADALEYNPYLGPQITNEMWTEEMLTDDITTDILKNIKNPAEFLNARLDRLQRPTDATVVNGIDGGTSPTNPSFLSTRAQAEAMRERLLDLGLDVGDIEAIEVSGGPFTTDWGTEDRRMFVIDGMSVGLMMEKYARNTVERADQMILDQYAA